MTTIKTKNGEIVLVEVDGNTNNLTIHDFALWRRRKAPKHWYGKLPDEMIKVLGRGDFKLLGTLNQTSESQAAEIGLETAEHLDMERPPIIGYKNYLKDNEFYYSALESLRSLIESKGMDVKRTVVIQKR